MTARRFGAVLLAAWLVAWPLTLSAIVTTQTTVANTATLVYTAATGGSVVLVRNAGAVSVFLGPSTVTTATGWELVAGAAASIPLGPADTLYGITASSTARVDAMESRR